MELDHIGGTFGGNRKPTAFIQLGVCVCVCVRVCVCVCAYIYSHKHTHTHTVLKLLQIQPEKEIVVEFIKNEDFKYVRALGAFYMRMVGKPIDAYQVRGLGNAFLNRL